MIPGYLLRRAAAGLLIVFFGAAAPARAADVDEPSGELRMLGWNNASSTSDCIGNARTPLCAVETAMACEKVQDHDLCLRAMPWERIPHMYAPDPLEHLSLVMYQVLGQLELGEADIPAEFRGGRWAWRSGDFALLIVRHACGPRPECRAEAKQALKSGKRTSWEECPTVQCMTYPVAAPRGVEARGLRTYIVRRTENAWQVIDQQYGEYPSAAYWGR